MICSCKTKVRTPVWVPLYIAVSFIGCSSFKLASRWREDVIPIDGSGSTWRDTLTVLDDRQTLLGVLNDQDYMYVRMVTTNRNLEGQIVRQGLVFWFDPTGGKDQKFGIRFPLGLGRFGGFSRNRMGNEENSGGVHGDSILVPVNNLEILGPGQGEIHKMSFAEATGIDARFRTSHDTLTYTLEVPISSSGYFPFTVGTTPGSVVGVTMGTASARTPGRESENPGEEGGRRGGYGVRGGYGGRGGGYGGGGFGRGRNENTGQTKPFEQFLKVQLADSTSHTQE